MFTKLSNVVRILILFSLVLGMASCRGEDPIPTWEKVFDPGIETVNDYQTYTIEVFKDQLYATVSSGSNTFSSSKDGLIFRSPDGKTWTPVTEFGFDLGNYDHISDLIVFQDKLYIIPADWDNQQPALILRTTDGTNWESVDSIGFSFQNFAQFVDFKGMMYVNSSGKDFTSHVWRSASGDRNSWKIVAAFPGMNFPGTFEVFKDWLYMISDVYQEVSGTNSPSQIWRSQDGENWKMVIADGFGNPKNDSGGAFETFDGYLYAGIGSFQEGGIGQIWRTKDGVTWEPVVEDGFGNPKNVKIDGLVAFQKYLYAYSLNWDEGCMLYRTKDGKNWVVANEPGWGDPSNWTSHLNTDQTVFKGDLYMGIFGQKGGLMKMVNP